MSIFISSSELAPKEYSPEISIEKAAQVIKENRYTELLRRYDRTRELSDEEKKIRRMTLVERDKYLQAQALKKNQLAFEYGKILRDALEDRVQSMLGSFHITAEMIDHTVQDLFSLWKRRGIDVYPNWKWIDDQSKFSVSAKEDVREIYVDNLYFTGFKRIPSGVLNVSCTEPLKRFLAGQYSDYGIQISFANVDEEGNWIEE